MKILTVKPDLFIILMIITLVLSYFFPQFGDESNQVLLDLISSAGVALIFFFYGLKLKLGELKKDLVNWKLHLMVQITTFVLFPLVILPFSSLVESEKDGLLWLSFFFLAALPSTVSSSVVMVSMAGGNVASAIFNAGISGIIGILVTPLWMSPFIGQTGSFNLADVYLSLLCGILLPLTLGVLLQKFGNKPAVRFSKELGWFDKTIILLIIYKSFAKSFNEGLFSGIGINYVLVVFGLVILMFFVVYYLLRLMSKLMRFEPEDQIVLKFCGTKKSLVHGTVFSKALFGSSAGMGMILLPLMIYHAVQLIVIGTIASNQDSDNNMKK